MIRFSGGVVWVTCAAKKILYGFVTRLLVMWKLQIVLLPMSKVICDTPGVEAPRLNELPAVNDAKYAAFNPKYILPDGALKYVSEALPRNAQLVDVGVTALPANQIAPYVVALYDPMLMSVVPLYWYFNPPSF